MITLSFQNIIFLHNSCKRWRLLQTGCLMCYNYRFALQLTIDHVFIILG